MSSFVTLIQNAFGWIEATSIRVSVLIVAVVILRAVLGRWLTAGLRYALSILVLAGLLIPVTPRSALSLENLFRKSADFSNSNSAQLAPVSAPMLSAQATRSAWSPSLHQVAALVWLAGCLALVTIALWRHRELRRLIADGLPVHDSDLLGMLRSAKESMGVRRPISLAVTERLDIPAVFGLRQTCLLLPARVLEQLSTGELRMVLLHELAHVRRNDLLVNWILMAGQFLHWFNPLVWLALHRFRADRELVCDAMVLRQLQSAERPEYGKVLLKLLEALRNESLLGSGAIPVISGRREMKERIVLIKHHRKASVAACLGMALLVAGLGCTTLTRAREPKSAVSNPALAMNVTNVSATRLEKEHVNPPVSSDASTNVVRIDIKRIGPTWVSEEFVRSNISLADGHAFDLTVVDNDVRKLYATEHFYSIKVATEPSPAGSIVSYILQDRPRVKAIKFIGNKRFSDTELLRAVLTKADGPFNERKVFNDAQLIQKRYYDAGFKNAEVKYQLQIDQKDGRGTITFKVEENPEGADRTSSTDSLPAASMTEEQARSFARLLANQKTQALYNCMPFHDGPLPQITDGRWVWHCRQGFGAGDFEASVEFAPDGGQPKVRVLFMDSRPLF